MISRKDKLEIMQINDSKNPLYSLWWNNILYFTGCYDNIENIKKLRNSYMSTDFYPVIENYDRIYERTKFDDKNRIIENSSGDKYIYHKDTFLLKNIIYQAENGNMGVAHEYEIGDEGQILSTNHGEGAKLKYNYINGKLRLILVAEAFDGEYISFFYDEKGNFLFTIDNNSKIPVIFEDSVKL